MKPELPRFTGTIASFFITSTHHSICCISQIHHIYVTSSSHTLWQSAYHEMYDSASAIYTFQQVGDVIRKYGCLAGLP